MGSPYCLAVPNGIALATGLTMLIVGIVLATHKMEDVHCVDQSTQATENREGANSYAFLGGVPAIFAALFAIIGGPLGAFGGMNKSKCSVGCTAALLAICTSTSLICFFTSWLGHAIGSIFDEYECNTVTEGLCYDKECLAKQSANSDTYAYTYCVGICEEDVDAFQAYSAKSQAAMVVSFILMIVACVASVFDCAACCCCPEALGMEAQSLVQVHNVGAVTYGQPAAGQVVQAQPVVGQVVQAVK